MVQGKIAKLQLKIVKLKIVINFFFITEI